MAAAIKLDTLKFAKRLTGVGLTQEQAEAIVEGLADADTAEFATKQDIAELRRELQVAVAELKADAGGTKAELFRFLYLQAAGIIGITVALIKLLP